MRTPTPISSEIKPWISSGTASPVSTSSPGANQYGNQYPGQFGSQLNGQYRNQLNGQNGNLPNGQYGNARTRQLTNSSFDRSANARRDQPGNEQTGQFGTPNTSIIDTVGANNAEINWEYAVIERLDPHDLSTRLIPFRLAGAIDAPNSLDNMPLQAGDVVTIFARSDLDLPMEKHASFVRVGGEVNAPGVYRVNPGDTLRDLVKRAGGLTSHSYLYASVFARASTRHAQEQQLRQSTEQLQRELTSQFANATPAPGQTGVDQQAQLAMQQAALAKLSSIKPTGRVVLDMKPDAATVEDIPDFPLEDGDTFNIPPRMSTVQVSGAVYNQNAFRYQPDKRLIAYLGDSGGATREADRKRMFVIRADGTVVSRQSHGNLGHGSFEKLKLLPGDAIVVPEKLRVSSKMANIMQATQFASQTALTAAALSVIR